VPFVVGTSSSPFEHTLHIFTNSNKRYRETKLLDYVNVNNWILQSKCKVLSMRCQGNEHLWFDPLHQTPKAP
jgi:hypothetical protein